MRYCTWGKNTLQHRGLSDGQTLIGFEKALTRDHATRGLIDKWTPYHITNARISRHVWVSKPHNVNLKTCNRYTFQGYQWLPLPVTDMSKTKYGGATWKNERIYASYSREFRRTTGVIYQYDHSDCAFRRWKPALQQRFKYWRCQ